MTHYELSRLDDLIDSTAHAAEQAHCLETGTCSPKWLVVAAHSAAQAAMTCYLHQGNGLATLREKDRQAWQKAHEIQQAESTPFQGYPDVRLNYFMELYADVKATALTKRDGCVTSSLCGDMERRMYELNQLRNSLIHFQTGRLLILKQHVVSVAQAASKTVNALSESQFFPWWRSDEAEHSRSQLERDLRALDRSLCSLNSTPQNV